MSRLWFEPEMKVWREEGKVWEVVTYINIKCIISHFLTGWPRKIFPCMHILAELYTLLWGDILLTHILPYSILPLYSISTIPFFSHLTYIHTVIHRTWPYHLSLISKTPSLFYTSFRHPLFSLSLLLSAKYIRK